MKQIKRSRFKLVGDTQRDHCIEQITQLYDAGHRFEVEVGPITNDRSKAQNRLYWKWLTVISELGESVNYYHIYFKRHILAKIYLAEGNVEGLKERVDRLKEIKPLVSDDAYEEIAKTLADAITTTAATVQQFTQYLQEIEKWSIDMGIILPRSDDYDLAMNGRG